MEVPSESELRRKIRQRAKASLYYFCSVVLQMTDLIPELHLPFANYIQMNPWNGGPPESLRKLAWMPRGHFKSSIVSVGYPLWLLIHDPNTAIALISSAEKNTQKWLFDIKQTIEHNLFFQWAFGEIQKGNKWDANQLTIKRDRDFGINVQASITAYTLKGGLASAHHPHLILDDPLNEQTAFSERERERAIELYVHLESIISKYSESMFTVVGTPWPGYDVIQHAMEHEVAHGERLFWGIGALGGFDCSEILKESHPEVIPQVEERIKRDGVIFSEVCPMQKLEKIKRQDLNQWYFQYLCSRPEEDDNGFETSLIRDFSLSPAGEIQCGCHPDHSHDLSRLVLCAICDPALSVAGDACESAIVVVGRDPSCGCRFILEEWGGRIHTSELIEKMCEVAQRWKLHLRRFAIEDVHFQSVFKSWLFELQATGRFPLGVELYGVKPKRRDKDLRIAGQQTYVAEGYWHKRPPMMTQPENLLWQIEKWPNQPKKRDRVDAWAYCDDAWEGLSPIRKVTDRENNPLAARNKQLARRQLRQLAEAQEA